MASLMAFVSTRRDAGFSKSNRLDVAQDSKEIVTKADDHVIRSASNPTIRRLIRLRDNRFRRRSQRVLVDGWRECRHAIEGGLRLVGMYVCESIEATDQEASNVFAFHDVLFHAQQRQVLQRVTTTILQRIGYGQSARGVVAEFHEPERTLASLKLAPVPLILVLDQIEKPGNVGAVFRCADAAGVDAVILSGQGDLFNPNAIRNSLGAVFRVPSAFATADQIQTFFLERGIRVLAARVESATSMWASDLTGPLAIVLGSEADGLQDRWQTLGNNSIDGIQIPMTGVVDSLNVSVSAAVIAYEALRIRNSGGFHEG